MTKPTIVTVQVKPLQPNAALPTFKRVPTNLDR
jgi:hypothetical protein